MGPLFLLGIVAVPMSFFHLPLSKRMMDDDDKDE